MSITSHIQLINDALDDLGQARLMSSTATFVENGCGGPAAVFTGSEYIEYDIAGSYLDDPSLTDGLSIFCRTQCHSIADTGYIIASGGQTTGAIGVCLYIHQNALRGAVKTRNLEWGVTHPWPGLNIDVTIGLIWTEEDGLILVLNGEVVDIDISPISHSTTNDYNTLTIGKPNIVNKYATGTIGFANKEAADRYGQTDDNLMDSWGARHVISYRSNSAGSNAVRCQFQCWNDQSRLVEVVWGCKPL